MNSGDTEASLVTHMPPCHRLLRLITESTYTLYLHGMAKDDIQCRKVKFVELREKAPLLRDFNLWIFLSISSIFV